MSLLSVAGLRVQFRTRRAVVTAVDGVGFELERGRTLGIVGESGSGKSVTCLSLLGLLPPSARIEAGSALFDGRQLIGAAPRLLRSVRGRRIAMVFQDPLSSLNPYMSIAAQMIEPLRLHLGLSRAAARERAIAALAEAGIADAPARIDDYPHEFSGGMRQRVMIAMAISTGPEVLIADEPTTALDVTVQAQILDLIRGLRMRRSLATIFISHNLAVVAGIADDVLVMRRGVCVERGPAAEVLGRPRHEYTQQLLAAIPRSLKPAAPPPAAGGPLLVLDGIRVEFTARRQAEPARGPAVFRAVDGVSLTLRRGEILGLVGESGSGKSTLARAIARLVEPSAGTLLFDGVPWLELRGARLRAARPRLQMVFQDAHSSLDPRMTVAACLGEALRARRHSGDSRVAEETARLLREVGLAPGLAGRYPHQLSSGQRQRLALARALALQPEIIVADEPVSSLDVTVQAQILELLLDLNRRLGLTFLVISHDLAVIRRIADRVAVMYRGRLVEVGAAATVLSEPVHPYTRLLLSALPAAPPGLRPPGTDGSRDGQAGN